MPDLEPPSAHAEPDVFVDITILVDDAWSDSAGLDPRGYQWRPPGTHIIAAWSDTGRQLAEVKVEYAFDDTAEGKDISDTLISTIAEALHDLYHPTSEAP